MGWASQRAKRTKTKEREREWERDKTKSLAFYACGRALECARFFVRATTTRATTRCVINRKLSIRLHSSERNYCATGNRRGNNSKNAAAAKTKHRLTITKQITVKLSTVRCLQRRHRRQGWHKSRSSVATLHSRSSYIASTPIHSVTTIHSVCECWWG